MPVTGVPEVRDRGGKQWRRGWGAALAGLKAPATVPGSCTIGLKSPGAGAGEPRGRGKKPQRRCPGGPGAGQKASTSMLVSPAVGAKSPGVDARQLRRRGFRACAQGLDRCAQGSKPCERRRVGRRTPTAVSPMAHNAAPDPPPDAPWTLNPSSAPPCAKPATART